MAFSNKIKLEGRQAMAFSYLRTASTSFILIIVLVNLSYCNSSAPSPPSTARRATSRNFLNRNAARMLIQPPSLPSAIPQDRQLLMAYMAGGPKSNPNNLTGNRNNNLDRQGRMVVIPYPLSDPAMLNARHLESLKQLRQLKRLQRQIFNTTTNLVADDTPGDNAGLAPLPFVQPSSPSAEATAQQQTAQVDLQQQQEQQDKWTTTDRIISQICYPNLYGNQPHPFSCERFVQCFAGRGIENDCPPATKFDIAAGVCNWPGGNAGDQKQSSVCDEQKLALFRAVLAEYAWKHRTELFPSPPFQVLDEQQHQTVQDSSARTATGITATAPNDVSLASGSFNGAQEEDLWFLPQQQQPAFEELTVHKRNLLAVTGNHNKNFAVPSSLSNKANERLLLDTRQDSATWQNPTVADKLPFNQQQQVNDDFQFQAFQRRRRRFLCPSRVGLFRDEQDPQAFFNCWNFRSHRQVCPGDLWFSERLQWCDFPENVVNDVAVLNEGVTNTFGGEPRKQSAQEETVTTVTLSDMPTIAVSQPQPVGDQRQPQRDRIAIRQPAPLLLESQPVDESQFSFLAPSVPDTVQQEPSAFRSPNAAGGRPYFQRPAFASSLGRNVFNRFYEEVQRRKPVVNTVNDRETEPPPLLPQQQQPSSTLGLDQNAFLQQPLPFISPIINSISRNQGASTLVTGSNQEQRVRQPPPVVDAFNAENFQPQRQQIQFTVGTLAAEQPIQLSGSGSQQQTADDFILRFPNKNLQSSTRFSRLPLVITNPLALNNNKQRQTAADQPQILLQPQHQQQPQILPVKGSNFSSPPSQPDQPQQLPLSASGNESARRVIPLAISNQFSIVDPPPTSLQPPSSPDVSQQQKQLVSWTFPVSQPQTKQQEQKQQSEPLSSQFLPPFTKLTTTQNNNDAGNETLEAMSITIDNELNSAIAAAVAQVTTTKRSVSSNDEEILRAPPLVSSGTNVIIPSRTLTEALPATAGASGQTKTNETRIVTTTTIAISSVIPPPSKSPQGEIISNNKQFFQAPQFLPEPNDINLLPILPKKNTHDFDARVDSVHKPPSTAENVTLTPETDAKLRAAINALSPEEVERVNEIFRKTDPLYNSSNPSPSPAASEPMRFNNAGQQQQQQLATRHALDASSNSFGLVVKNEVKRPQNWQPLSTILTDTAGSANKTEVSPVIKFKRGTAITQRTPPTSVPQPPIYLTAAVQQQHTHYSSPSSSPFYYPPLVDADEVAIAEQQMGKRRKIHKFAEPYRLSSKTPMFVGQASSVPEFLRPSEARTTAVQQKQQPPTLFFGPLT